MAQRRRADEKKPKVRKPDRPEKSGARQTHDPGGEASGLVKLQRQVGNRAVQRLLAQRSGDGAFTLDDDTAGRINRARRGGQRLEGAVESQMGQKLGHDFSDVRVHTSAEADKLSQQLNAKAFTTGQDIFFKEGAYNPHSGAGQELIAHELTHVAQQNSGATGGVQGKMRVNAPDDAFERQADSVAAAVTGPETQLQRQEEEEEVAMKCDESVQRQEEEEEEELQMKRDETVQRQEELPEEEL